LLDPIEREKASNIKAVFIHSTKKKKEGKKKEKEK